LIAAFAVDDAGSRPCQLGERFALVAADETARRL
jgi:hypothetical protein